MRATIDAERLATTWFGSGLDHPVRLQLAGAGRRRVLEVGDVLMREGGPADELGLVLGGRLAIRLDVPGRGQATILTVEAGDLVGWSAFVAPYRATATVIASAPTELVAWDGAWLRRALQRDGELAAAIYPRVLATVARRLAGTRGQFLDMFASPVADPW